MQHTFNPAPSPEHFAESPGASAILAQLAHVAAGRARPADLWVPQVLGLVTIPPCRICHGPEGVAYHVRKPEITPAGLRFAAACRDALGPLFALVDLHAGLAPAEIQPEAGA